MITTVNPIFIPVFLTLGIGYNTRLIPELRIGGCPITDPGWGWSKTRKGNVHCKIITEVSHVF